MMPLSISEKILRLAAGEQLPASQLRHVIITELVSEGIIMERITGRTKRTLYITDTVALNNWLHNKFSIRNLGHYIATLKNENASRADLVEAVNDSKTRSIRTFKGFLVNSYMPVESILNGKSFTIHPVIGTFQFVYDFANFIPAPDVVVVGIENVENFSRIEEQQYLFKDIKPLFVCRYPQEQGRDQVKWLRSIPNAYLHFGDYDLAGINIYLQEYKRHLSDRATFFIPGDIEQLIEKHGNRKLYDRQQLNTTDNIEDNLQMLISLLHKHKKGLEQEALLIKV